MDEPGRGNNNRNILIDKDSTSDEAEVKRARKNPIILPMGNSAAYGTPVASPTSPHDEFAPPLSVLSEDEGVGSPPLSPMGNSTADRTPVASPIYQNQFDISRAYEEQAGPPNRPLTRRYSTSGLGKGQLGGATSPPVSRQVHGSIPRRNRRFSVSGLQQKHEFPPRKPITRRASASVILTNTQSGVDCENMPPPSSRWRSRASVAALFNRHGESSENTLPISITKATKAIVDDPLASEGEFIPQGIKEEEEVYSAIFRIDDGEAIKYYSQCKSQMKAWKKDVYNIKKSLAKDVKTLKNAYKTEQANYKRSLSTRPIYPVSPRASQSALDLTNDTVGEQSFAELEDKLERICSDASDHRRNKSKTNELLMKAQERLKIILDNVDCGSTSNSDQAAALHCAESYLLQRQIVRCLVKIHYDEVIPDMTGRVKEFIIQVLGFLSQRNKYVEARDQLASVKKKLLDKLKKRFCLEDGAKDHRLYNKILWNSAKLDKLSVEELLDKCNGLSEMLFSKTKENASAQKDSAITKIQHVTELIDKFKKAAAHKNIMRQDLIQMAIFVSGVEEKIESAFNMHSKKFRDNIISLEAYHIKIALMGQISTVNLIQTEGIIPSANTVKSLLAAGKVCSEAMEGLKQDMQDIQERNELCLKKVGADKIKKLSKNHRVTKFKHGKTGKKIHNKLGNIKLALRVSKQKSKEVAKRARDAAKRARDAVSLQVIKKGKIYPIIIIIITIVATIVIAAALIGCMWIKSSISNVIIAVAVLITGVILVILEVKYYKTIAGWFVKDKYDQVVSAIVAASFISFGILVYKIPLLIKQYDKYQMRFMVAAVIIGIIGIIMAIIIYNFNIVSRIRDRSKGGLISLMKDREGSEGSIEVKELEREAKKLAEEVKRLEEEEGNLEKEAEAEAEGLKEAEEEEEEEEEVEEEAEVEAEEEMSQDDEIESMDPSSLVNESLQEYIERDFERDEEMEGEDDIGSVVVSACEEECKRLGKSAKGMVKEVASHAVKSLIFSSILYGIELLATFQIST